MTLSIQQLWDKYSFDGFIPEENFTMRGKIATIRSGRVSSFGRLPFSLQFSSLKGKSWNVQNAAIQSVV